MKASKECYNCLARLLRQAAELATDEPALRLRVIEDGQMLLDREFSTDKTTIAVATLIHRLVRSLTGNADPYNGIKEAELEMAAGLMRELEYNSEGDIRKCLVYAVRGNNIDFFKDIEEIKEEITGPVEFTIDDTMKLEEKLREAKNMLYLADNAGEVPFDIPLVNKMADYAPVTYVVKESPVQDDITLEDLKKFGMMGALPRVISTGTDTPGVDMDMASSEFKAEFEAADLVLAKGMGFWETLTELPAQGKVFHLLKAKCQPVADSLGVALNSYVAYLR
ncbi:MAG TPA: DUF89 family protein [Dehalococcoidia bacterium]|nr:DUF89 family protein [Dehalococcoidia bacterium]